MDKNEFFKRINERDFENLEKELINNISISNNLTDKYFLGICYSNQFKKRKKAISIFKELLKSGFKCEELYLYLARNIGERDEGEKVINEGIKNYPNSILLKQERIFFIDDLEKEEYFQNIKNEIELNFYTKLEMLSHFYQKRLYKEAFEIIKDIKEDECLFGYDIMFLKIIIGYMANNKMDINTINKFLVVNNDELRKLIVNLIEIVNEKSKNKIMNFIEQLNYEVDTEYDLIEIIDFDTERGFYFTFGEIFKYLIKSIQKIVEDEDIERKLNIIYYFFLGTNNKEECRIFKKLIELEIKKKKNLSLYFKLMEIYIELGNNKKYFNIYVDAVKISSQQIDIYLDEFNYDEIIYIINTIKKFPKKFNTINYQKLIRNLVIKLHEQKKHNDIVRLFDFIDYNMFNYIQFGFELAYAFKENGKNEKAKKIYEEYLNKYPNSSATINNLGVIYEQEHNYEKAFKYYKRAEEIEHSDISLNNIERLKKELELENKAIDFFEKENVWFIDRIKNFYEDADDKGNVICPYRRLPILLKCNEEKSKDVLDQMLDKGYIFRNTNHDYDTIASVYKINSCIKYKIEEIDKENQLINNFIGNFNNLTLSNLADIEYKEIISKLKSIKNIKIKDILVRDYNELIFNYLTNQQKSVVLLSGTIIELLLLFILDSKEIRKYKIGVKQKEKKVLEMDITEMLEVCDFEKLISNTPKKFIDGMKQFRNFIHPGREIRENNFKLDKSTVELSFNIVNWLILNFSIE